MVLPLEEAPTLRSTSASNPVYRKRKRGAPPLQTPDEAELLEELALQTQAERKEIEAAAIRTRSVAARALHPLSTSTTYGSMANKWREYVLGLTPKLALCVDLFMTRLSEEERLGRWVGFIHYLGERLITGKYRGAHLSAVKSFSGTTLLWSS